MLFKIHPSRALRAVLAATLAPLAARAQGPCAPEVADTIAGACRAYRTGALDSAAARFRGAERLCPDALESTLGLGFVAFRQDRAAEADKPMYDSLAVVWSR
jgi:hypothetical protein